MIYSIFDSTGNLVDAFNDRSGALNYMHAITQADNSSAGELFVIAQDHDEGGDGEIVLASPSPPA
jgi:hypothetical protein